MTLLSLTNAKILVGAADLSAYANEVEVSAGGVHLGYAADEPDALLVAYLNVVRTLRRRRFSPVVELPASWGRLARPAWKPLRPEIHASKPASARRSGA